ncbi:hypothetical protein ACTJKO_07655 [Curtobacterium sp. 22159]|uniref:hypothetical protein n=1 Tax=Curtobacterium sp. 22159 TaxID=3453882 RepID=UPI003F82A744
MARTTIPVTRAVANGSVTDPAATTVTAANGGTIPNADTEHLLLRVAATGAATVTIKAGAMPPAIAAGLGDEQIAVGANATAWVGPLESGRFIQADGSLAIDTSADVAVTAIVVPKAA